MIIGAATEVQRNSGHPRYPLTDHCDYQDLGGDYFVRRDTERARQRAVAQLQALGYRVTLEPLAA